MVPAVDGGRAAAGGRNYSVASITVPIGGDGAVKYDDCQTGKEMMQMIVDCVTIDQSVSVHARHTTASWSFALWFAYARM